MKLSTEAEAALTKFYASVGAKSVDQKINALTLKVGNDYAFHSFEGDNSHRNQMILGFLEYEYLGILGLVETVLV